MEIYDTFVKVLDYAPCSGTHLFFTCKTFAHYLSQYFISRMQSRDFDVEKKEHRYEFMVWQSSMHRPILYHMYMNADSLEYVIRAGNCYMLNEIILQHQSILSNASSLMAKKITLGRGPFPYLSVRLAVGYRNYLKDAIAKFILSNTQDNDVQELRQVCEKIQKDLNHEFSLVGKICDTYNLALGVDQILRITNSPETMSLRLLTTADSFGCHSEFLTPILSRLNRREKDIHYSTWQYRLIRQNGLFSPNSTFEPSMDFYTYASRDKRRTAEELMPWNAIHGYIPTKDNQGQTNIIDNDREKLIEKHIFKGRQSHYDQTASYRALSLLYVLRPYDVEIFERIYRHLGIIFLEYPKDNESDDSNSWWNVPPRSEASRYGDSEAILGPRLIPELYYYHLHYAYGNPNVKYRTELYSTIQAEGPDYVINLPKYVDFIANQWFYHMRNHPNPRFTDLVMKRAAPILYNKVKYLCDKYGKDED